MAWIDEIKKALKANPGKSVAEVIPIAKKTYAESKKNASSTDVVKKGVDTVSKATKKMMPKKAKKSRKAKKSKRTRRAKGKRSSKKSKRGGGSCSSKKSKRGGGSCSSKKNKRGGGCGCDSPVPAM